MPMGANANNGQSGQFKSCDYPSGRAVGHETDLAVPCLQDKGMARVNRGIVIDPKDVHLQNSSPEVS